MTVTNPGMETSSRPSSPKKSRIQLPIIEESVPGPNAFALKKAKDEKELEKHRLLSNAFYQQEKKTRVRPDLMLHPAFRGDPQSRSSDEDAKAVSSRASEVTTMSQFIRSESATPSAEPMPATAREKILELNSANSQSPKLFHHERRNLNERRNLKERQKLREQKLQKMMEQGSELKLAPDNTQDSQPTDRQFIEAKNEKKLQKMMGDGQTTPSSATFQTTTFQTPAKTITFASAIELLKPVDKSVGNDAATDPPKSPKKKILERLHIPSFRSGGPSVHQPTTPEEGIAPKAAQFFGTSPSKKGSLASRRKDKQGAIFASLPSRTPDAHYFNDSPVNPMNLGETAASIAASTAASTVASTASESNDRGPKRVISQPLSEHAIDKIPIEKSTLTRSQSLHYFNTIPPTPPAKNTPPDRKSGASAVQQDAPSVTRTRSLKRQSGSRDLNSPREMISGDGRLSPTRYGGYGSKEYISLIEKVPSFHSMRGSIQEPASSAPIMAEANYSPAEPVGRWSEGQIHAWQTQNGLLPGGYLPQTFYSPSIYSSGFGTRPTATMPPPPHQRAEMGKPVAFYLQPSPQFHDVPATRIIHPSSSSEASIPVIWQGTADELDGQPAFRVSPILGLGAEIPYLPPSRADRSASSLDSPNEDEDTLRQQSFRRFQGRFEEQADSYGPTYPPLSAVATQNGDRKAVTHFFHPNNVFSPPVLERMNGGNSAQAPLFETLRGSGHPAPGMSPDHYSHRSAMPSPLNGGLSHFPPMPSRNNASVNGNNVSYTYASNGANATANATANADVNTATAGLLRAIATTTAAMENLGRAVVVLTDALEQAETKKRVG